MQNPSDRILKTKFTGQWVAEKITESLGSKAELEAWSGGDINRGLGFLSDIFKMKLHWKDGTFGGENAPPSSVVLKVGLSASVLRARFKPIPQGEVFAETRVFRANSFIHR